MANTNMPTQQTEQSQVPSTAFQNQMTHLQDQISEMASSLKERFKSVIPEAKNIKTSERTISNIVGGALAIYALRKFIDSDYTRGALALAGSSMLIARGASGKCAVKKAITDFAEHRQQDQQQGARGEDLGNRGPGAGPQDQSGDAFHN